MGLGVPGGLSAGVVGPRGVSGGGQGFRGGPAPPPPLGQFQPQLVLVAAGFDAALGDPEVPTGTYRHL